MHGFEPGKEAVWVLPLSYHISIITNSKGNVLLLHYFSYLKFNFDTICKLIVALKNNIPTSSPPPPSPPLIHTWWWWCWALDNRTVRLQLQVSSLQPMVLLLKWLQTSTLHITFPAAPATPPLPTPASRQVLRTHTHTRTQYNRFSLHAQSRFFPLLMAIFV